MPTISGLQIPPPAHWQDFEILCCDLWRLIWNDPNTQRNGRQGQPQHGVDVYGRPDEGETWAGVQCKGKDNYSSRKLTKKELLDETEKANAFKPEISKFVLATTGPRDSKVQELARKVTQEHQKKGLFSVHVWFWEDIVNRMADFPSVIEKHYPKILIEVEKRHAGKPHLFTPHPYSLQSNFTGRVEERKTLSDWFCSNNKSVCSLTAIGGMGKSALAWVWLHLDILNKPIPGVEVDSPDIPEECTVENNVKPGGIFHWSFYLGETHFSRFLTEACRFTGGEPTPAVGEDKISDSARLDTLISRTQKNKYLFILDGFERLLQAYSSQDAPLLEEKDAEEYSERERRCPDLLVDRFLSNIASGGQSKFLLTTRLVPTELENAPGFENIYLSGLNDEDANQFFRKNDIKGSKREKVRVANQYNNHPLSLAHLINYLKKRGNSDIVNAPKYDPSLKVRGRQEHILAQSYRILPDKWKSMLSRISAIRGSIDFWMIKLVCEGYSNAELEDIFFALEDMRWVFYDHGTKQVDYHPLVRRYCYRQMDEGERIEVHEILREYWEEKANVNLPSIHSVLNPAEEGKKSELDIIIESRDNLAKDLHPEKDAGYKSMTWFLKSKKITERVPLLDMILKYISGSENPDSVAVHKSKYLQSLGDDTPTIADVFEEKLLKEVVERRDKLAEEVLDKEYAKKQREAFLFPERSIGLKTLRGFLNRKKITEDVPLVKTLFKNEDGKPVLPFVILGYKYFKSLGDKCPTLDKIFDKDTFENVEKVRDALAKGVKEGALDGIKEEDLYPEKNTRFKNLINFLKKQKIIENPPLLQYYAMVQAKGQVDIVANHIAKYFKKFPEKAPTYVEMLSKEEIKTIKQARDKMADEVDETKFETKITEEQLYPENDSEYDELIELLKDTRINEKLVLLDILFGEIKKQSIDSVTLMLDLHLKSLDQKDIPSIASVLSKDELKAIRDGQEQLEKILFPEKEAGFGSLEEFLRNTSVDERVQLLDIILEKDSRKVHMARGLPKPKSLDDLSPVIELYHHTVQAGRYDDAFGLFYERLNSPLYYQFGAYQTFVELQQAMFDKGDWQKPLVKDDSKIARLCNDSANSYSLSGQPRRAVLLFEMQNILRDKADDKKNLAIGLGNLALDMIRIADLRSAKSNLRRRIEIAKEIDVRKDQPHMEIARTEAYTGRFEECEKSLKEAEKDDQGPQSFSVINAYRSHRALLMDAPAEALKCAQKALEFAEKDAAKTFYKPRDFIEANLYIGASYVAMGKPEKSEQPLNSAITECRKINLVQLEAPILLELAKLRHLQSRDDESLSLATEALYIANRCSYVLQQADIEQFLGEFYMDQGDMEKARKYIDDCIEHCTHCWRYCEGEPDFEYVRREDDFYYVKKEEKWWYKPRWEKAMEMMKRLEVET